MLRRMQVRSMFTTIVVATVLASSAALADPPAQRQILFLANDTATDPDHIVPLLRRELFRQALLIAARDELGIATRDQSLREWEKPPPADLTLETIQRGFDLQVQLVAGGKVVSQPTHVREVDNEKDAPIVDFCDIAEKMSRKEDVELLQSNGWGGAANRPAPNDGPAPDEVERALSDFESLSQFQALRMTHAAIREKGESPARLAALVRGYANLARLTSFHWSLESRVFGARALLYAQRMVNRDLGSAFALWHRAYARALVGLPHDALDDLTAAAKSGADQAPPWVVPLTDFCKYDLDGVSQLARRNQDATTWYLAFLCAEPCECQGAVMKTAQDAFKAMPDCQQILSTMCAWTGPGMLNSLSEVAPQIFSQTLAARLPAMPGMPGPILDEMRGLQRPGGNPLGRETICNALIDESGSDRDRGEPSWAVLGRLIQETTFEMTCRRAELIAFQWGIDASDYVEETRPLIAEHPFRQVIEAYGLAHQLTAAPMMDTLLAQSTVDVPHAALPLMTMLLRNAPRAKAETPWNRYLNYSDDLEPDITELAYLTGHLNSNHYKFGRYWLHRLQRVSPDAPLLIAAAILGQYDVKETDAWLSQNSVYPLILNAQAQHLTSLGKYTDAAGALEQYLAVSPDSGGYDALANLYRRLGRDDDWLEVKKASLGTPDYGLEHERTQVEIADFFMRKGQYSSALPYADAAAQTAAASGLLCDAAVHADMGDYKTAETLYIDEYQHYSTTPYRWLAVCVHSGQGNKAGALKAEHDFLDARKAVMSSDDMAEAGCLAILENDDAAARKIFQARYKRHPGILSAFHLILLANRAHDGSARQATIDETKKWLSARGTPQEKRIFHPFEVAYTDQSKTLDLAEVDIAIASQPWGEEMNFAYAAACCLINAGQSALAVDCLKRHYHALNAFSVDLPLIDEMLRSNGVDPTTLADASLQQAQ